MQSSRPASTAERSSVLKAHEALALSIFHGGFLGLLALSNRSREWSLNSANCFLVLKNSAGSQA